MLRSLKTPKRSYIGYTDDARTRLRKHNGLIAGGAAKTMKQRPWEFAAIVTGFPSSKEARAFEWAWQHPFPGRLGFTMASRIGEPSAYRVLRKELQKLTEGVKRGSNQVQRDLDVLGILLKMECCKGYMVRYDGDAAALVQQTAVPLAPASQSDTADIVEIVDASSEGEVVDLT